MTVFQKAGAKTNIFFIKGITITMFSVQASGALSMKRFKRIVSVVCTACIIAAFLLNALLLTQLAGNENDFTPGCLRTRNPICTCDNKTTLLLQSRISAQTIIQPMAAHGEKLICISCATILKKLNPLRVQSFINSNIVFTDVVIFAFAAFIIYLLIPGLPDPVTLKAKLNN